MWTLIYMRGNETSKMLALQGLQRFDCIYYVFVQKM